ncbi:hypothetical protein LQW54_004887 [Pestalotiopsis sp. IQ-011]
MYPSHGKFGTSTILATTSLVLRLVLLILESRTKRGYLRDPYKALPTEQTVSNLNRAFLFWVNDVILLGNYKLLLYHDLPALDDKLESRRLRVRMEGLWGKTGKSDIKNASGHGGALLWVMIKFFRGSLSLNAFPRLLMIAFRYSQPVFINSTIKYVTKPSLTADVRDDTGYYLILAALVIYVGLATRGALIGLIHAACLTMRNGVYDDAAAVTHMSSDTDNVENLAWVCQEIWAQTIEFFIGIVMLWFQVGWWCLAPVVVVILFTQAAKRTGNRIGEFMADWQKAKQKRIALTTSMIDFIKNIKMMGMASSIMDKVQESRIVDLVTGLDYRWIIVYINLGVNGIGILASAVTLILYAADAHFRSESLDPTVAFTALATVTLVTTPAKTILSLFQQFATLQGCAARIQKYLLEPPRDDQRVLLDPQQPISGSVGNGDLGEEGSSAIIIRDAVLRPVESASICLDKISAHLDTGSLTILYGAVGTGKTTLARAILGDIAPDSGSILVSTKRIGYCAQKPWLVNASIKDMICGFQDETTINEGWYKTVIHACGLGEDIEKMPGRDLGIVGSRGVTLSGGQRQRVALARVVYSRPEIIILDDVLSALDPNTEAHVADMLLGPNARYLPMADKILVLANSKIVEQGTWDDLQSSAGYISQVEVKNSNSPTLRNTVEEDLPARIDTAQLADEDILDASRKSGDISVYLYYFRCVSLPIVALFLFCNVADGVLQALTPSILRMWSEAGGANTWLYATLYAISSLLAFAATGSVIWSTLILIAPKAGEVLHHRLLRIIMRAPLSYFTVTDAGVTLNRFTEDMTYVDHSLPFNLMNAFWQFSKVISQLVLLFITQASIGIGLPFLALVLYLLQRLYLHTSRQIRFLDIELRAKVLTNFLETLEGISHIRAFGWQSRFIDQNIENLDISQRAYYAMLSIQQWLTLVLDMLVAGLSILIVGLAVAFRSSTTGGQIGIALNIILTISGTLTRLLQSWTQLETSLGAIARIKTLEETLLPEDKECECIEPAPRWPEKGVIEFKNVSSSYNNSKSVALKGISMSISPGQRIGICGRTGSGKSTLLLSMLRLVELESGSITIDGLDLRTLPRDTIRARIIAIPQDTFILNASIRLNADALGIASDEEIVAALKKVQLWDILASYAANAAGAPLATPRPSDEEGEDAAILKASQTIDPLGVLLGDSALSRGQFQLFGLARALLLKERSRILVLDEATSNVDARTDELMQRIVREEFTQHTIIIVAHRLDTIRDVDTVFVMDKGRVVETGSPDELLAKKSEKNGEESGGDEDDEEKDLRKAWFRELWDSAH